MNAAFVRRHCRFGKARMRPTKRYPHAAWLGAPGSAWFLRAYPKPAIKGFRVEVQFNARSLALYEIVAPADLVRLPEILARQLGFYRVDWVRLARYIERNLRHPEALLSMARRRAAVLTALIGFLQRIGVSNPARFLIELPVNSQIAAALERWRRSWSNSGHSKNVRRGPHDRTG